MSLIEDVIWINGETSCHSLKMSHGSMEKLHVTHSRCHMDQWRNFMSLTEDVIWINGETSCHSLKMSYGSMKKLHVTH